MSFEVALRAYEEAKPNARFLEPISRHFQGLMVGEITGSELKRAANALYPKAAPATVRRQLYTPVKAILNMAAEDGGYAVPRFKAPSGGNKRTAFLLPAQAAKLLTALEANQNPYLAVMVTFLLGQGARLGEALTLKADAVSLEHKFAILRDTKNGEERRISLIPKVVKAMSALPTIEAGGTVFRRKDGQAFRYGGSSGGQISKVFATAAKEAGLDPAVITPHVCRHTWATWFYAQTKDVRRLQDEGGWKSGEWQRYTKLGTPDLGRSALRAGWNFRESV